MISVLMSVYKKEKPEYLARALDSIMAQSERPDEIVLVEDGPLTAGLIKVIERYELLCNGADGKQKLEAGKTSNGAYSSTGYPTFRRVRLTRNQGLGTALAAGMKACRGDLIARMDTDDIAARDRLRLQKRYMEAHPDISAVGGDICEFTDEANLHKAQAQAAAQTGSIAHRYSIAEEQGSIRDTESAQNPEEAQLVVKAQDATDVLKQTILRDTNLRIKHMPSGHEALYRYGKLRNPLNHMTVMLRKSDIEAVGGYRKRPLLEDYDLWSRLLAGGYRIDNISEILVYARVGEGFSDKRGGLRYFMEYASLRRMQLRIGYLHGWEYLIAVAATAAMTLVPARVRGEIYGWLRG